MPLYHAPKSFVSRLRAYDRDLQVTWSDYRQKWMIERKVRRGRLEYGTSPDPDVRRRFHEGRMLVFSVPYHYLDARVLKALQMADMWTHGGARGMNQQIDAEREFKESQDEKNQLADCKHLAGEMWDYMARLRRSRLNVPVNPLNQERINRGG